MFLFFYIFFCFIFRMYNIRAKKNLSQNFILDPRLLDRIARHWATRFAVPTVLYSSWNSTFFTFVHVSAVDKAVQIWELKLKNI